MLDVKMPDDAEVVESYAQAIASNYTTLGEKWVAAKTYIRELPTLWSAI